MNRAELEVLRRKVIRGSTRIVRECRQLIRDTEYWNDHVRKPNEGRIDIRPAELAQLIEHHELVIECAKKREKLPEFAGDLDAIAKDI